MNTFNCINTFCALRLNSSIVSGSRSDLVVDENICWRLRISKIRQSFT